MSDQDEDHFDDDAGKADPNHPGQAVAPQISEHRRARSFGKLKLAGSTALVAALGFGVYSYTFKAPTSLPAPVIPKSEPIYEHKVEEKPIEPTVVSRVEISPPLMSFGNLMAGQDHQTLALKVTAMDGPVEIDSIIMPFSDRNGLDMRADSCQGKKLGKGETCIISVTFAPITSTTLANQILIHGIRYVSGGKGGGGTEALSETVEVTGASSLPPPPPPKPVAVDYDQLRLNNMQSAYLSARARQTLGDQSREAYRAPTAPRDKDWAGLGFAKNESSFPVDMTRVVTLDKSIPVVLKVPIDARNPSRAIATVERDIYGGDGRLVVIERGSTLVGRVSAVADASEEKVGIDWQRLVRPDGVAFSFEATSGDAMGRAGVLAHIDNRWMERFGTTALASVVTAGITLGLNGTQTATTQNGTNVSGVNGAIITGGTTTNAISGRAAAAQQIRQDLLPLYEQFKNEQLALPVIRTVPAGTRITVWPSTDLWLKAAPSAEIASVATTSSLGGSSASRANPYASLATQTGGDGGGSHVVAQAPTGPTYQPVPGAAPATNANMTYDPASSGGPVDMGLKGESAAATTRERMSVTGSTAGSPYAAARAIGYANGAGLYGQGLGANPNLTSGGLIAAPPWSGGAIR